MRSTRVVAVALAFIASGCPESKPPSRSLRVALPEGWVATPGGAGVLQVGPKGRVVLTLERRTAALPTLNALRAAVEAEGASVSRAAATPDSTAVRYSKPDCVDGLVAARTLENGVVLLCASTNDAEAEELETAQSLCKGVRLESPP